MSTADPWLSIIGIGEDGLNGISAQGQEAIARAEVIMGAARHLELLGPTTAEQVTWPVPFADGVDQLLACAPRKTVMLASGDPFWFGAGTSITKHLSRKAWVAYPAPSSLSLAAARLGWPIEKTTILALHAAPFGRLRRALQGTDPACHILVTVRDGDAVHELAAYLCDIGFGESRLHILEALGGPREQMTTHTAQTLPADHSFAHPVIVGIEPQSSPDHIIPLASGIPDRFFDSDGQITKRPVRAMTLSALAPRAGEVLWDIGGGSGSIAIEWLMTHPTTGAVAFERDPVRAARIAQNAHALGQDRLDVIEGAAPDILRGRPAPDAIFIGGGLSDAMLELLFETCSGARLVANGVTLEAEAVLARWHGDKGGELMRIEIAQSGPIGRLRGWKSSYPIVQWSVTI